MGNKTNISLGHFLDGWAHLVEGEGNSAQVVRDNLIQRLHDREMSGIGIASISAIPKSGKPEPERPYIVTSKYPGFTTAIYIDSHGKDLYVSWKTYLKPPIAIENVFIAIASAIFIGIVVNILLRISQGAFFRNPIPEGKFLLTLGVSIVELIIFWAWAYPVLELIFGISGEFRPSTKKKIVGILLIPLFFPIRALINWITLTFTPPAPSPSVAYENFNRIPVYVLTILIFAILLLIYKVWQGKTLSELLFDVPTIFDADDAIAMSLSVHKSLLHALDQVGIDTSQLRLHNQTTQGRIGESV